MFPQIISITFSSEIEVSSIRIESKFVHKLCITTTKAAGAPLSDQELVLAHIEYPGSAEGGWQTKDILLGQEGRGAPIKTRSLCLTIQSGHGDFVALRYLSARGPERA
jgi:hypothetical protein